METSFRIYRNSVYSSNLVPCALTIGNFDGVHLGHQKILRQVNQEAKNRNLAPTVLTFHPSSKEYFSILKNRSGNVVTRISNFRDKFTLLERFGIRQVIMIRFNQELSQLSANLFIQNLLVKCLKTRLILVGKDFHFGYNQEGNLHTLKKTGLDFGFEVQVISNITDQFNRRISSSNIREALALGDLSYAKKMLGRPFSLSGRVIYGKQLGRGLGFPTINLRISKYSSIRTGIYVVKVYGLQDNRPLAGVANLGTRPTIEKNGQFLLEVHLLNKEINAYGKLVHIEFLHRLRDEEKFKNLSNLILAASVDRQDALTYFRLHGL